MMEAEGNVIDLMVALRDSLAQPDPDAAELPTLWIPKPWVELERGQGVWADEVDEAAYHRLPLASRSRLEVLRKSPALYWARFLADRRLPDEDTKALRVGRYCHCAVLEHDRWLRDFVGEPSWKTDGRTKEGKAERATWREANAGRAVVKADEHELAEAIRRAIVEPRSPSASRAKLMLVDAPFRERVAIWRDRVTGLLCRARIDAYTPGVVIADLKSADEVEVDDFAFAAGRHGYHRQAAMYIDAVEAVTGERLRFADVVVHKDEPNEVAIYELDEYAVEAGRRQYRSLLVELDRRMANDDWHSPCELGPQLLSLPGRFLEA